jgi:RNA polymerase sigma factor (sigma-70 family)
MNRIEVTDSQTLLSEYARTGSEAAFRELVALYLGLVYATALRLVGGDTHLAEDVAQLVFVDLARRAPGLSSGVMLGGWLHARTCNITRPMLRAERRRQSRERQVMSMVQCDPPDSGDDFTHIAPMLDEAITQLGKEDRTAIILRFFERRDFCSIGAALGSSEDAARMRVSRSLDKLQLLLKRRGVSLSAAALGGALSAEAVTAAPAGLAGTLAGLALAQTAPNGGITATLLKIGTMTKLKMSIVSAFVLMSLTTSLVLRRNAQADSSARQQSLREQRDQQAQIKADNERLSNLALSSNRSTSDPRLRELSQLRAEAESLRAQIRDLAALRDQNRALNAAQESRTPFQMREFALAKHRRTETWTQAFLSYARQNQGQLPSAFAQAAPFLPKDSPKETSLSSDQFEILYQGSVDALTDKNVIIFREKNLWKLQNGDGSFKWGRHYGMADGHVDYCSSSDKTPAGSFDSYEKEHLVRPAE